MKLDVIINLKKVACGVCLQHLTRDEGAFIRVTQCGHLHHEKHFFDGNHIKKIGKATCEVLCPQPGCNQRIVRVNEKKVMEELSKKIEKLELHENGAVHAKGYKYVSYFAVAVTTAIVALVIHASFFALGIGLVVSVPIGYLLGKTIDTYLLPRAGVPRVARPAVVGAYT